MDIYTLTPNFLADDVVDERVSAIWTERYWSAGDTNIVVEASQANIAKLKEGTYLALVGSEEVMEIKTANIKDGLLTVVGETILTFLDDRQAWFYNPESTDPGQMIADLTDDTRTPGEFISHVVDMMVINPTNFPSGYSAANLNWALEIIPGLSLGDVDASGATERLTAVIGPLYTSIQQVAEKKEVGISLYLDSADSDLGFSLKFKTYRGLDRTSGQTDNQLVRLSPNSETISSIEEIRSIKDFKNVVYVMYQGVVTKHLLYPDLPEPEGLERRVLVTNAEGEPVGHKVNGFWVPPSSYGSTGYWSTTQVGPGDIAAFRAQNAKDALANHNYIHSMDGETSPHTELTYGVDYGLGDVIELEGLLGDITKARITEYIRSQDATGEKEYPTISVVN